MLDAVIRLLADKPMNACGSLVGPKVRSTGTVSRFSIFDLKFEIYSTDESGSLNFCLKCWAARDECPRLVSVFGRGQKKTIIVRVPPVAIAPVRQSILLRWLLIP